MKKQFNRKKYLIDRPFQLKYLALIVSLLLLHTITVLAAVFGPSFYALRTGGSIQQQSEIAGSILLLHNTIWPGILAVIVLFGGISIFITHKMAGPHYRILTDLRELASGNFEKRITLRKGDELVELAEQINAVSERFCASRDKLLRNNDAIISALDNVRSELDAASPDREALLRQIEKIATESNNIAAVLAPQSYASDGESENE